MHEPDASRGMTVVETLLAVSLFVTLAAAAAELLVQARALAVRAGLEGSAIRAAVSRMERLRAVPWRIGLDGSIDDVTSLALSPPGALSSNAAGLYEWLDESGNPVAGAAGRRLIARWAVTLPATGDEAARALEVCVYAWPDGPGARPLACLASARGRQP